FDAAEPLGRLAGLVGLDIPVGHRGADAEGGQDPQALAAGVANVVAVAQLRRRLLGPGRALDWRLVEVVVDAHVSTSTRSTSSRALWLGLMPVAQQSGQSMPARRPTPEQLGQKSPTR